MTGIISYGAYIPKFRIKAEEIAKVHGHDPSYILKDLLVEEKSVPSLDEDSMTMGFEASLNALKRANIDRKRIGAVYSGSESPVYAVKPNASIIGEALGIGMDYTSADVEFACKAGTAAMQMVFGLSKSGFVDCGLAIGSDTAQSPPGDLIEHTSSAGAAAVLVSNKEGEIIAKLEAMHSVSSDTPDFWRRPEEKYPQYAERFTATPAYFKHVTQSVKELMKKTKTSPKDISHVAFHTPNGKFPLKAGNILGFDKSHLESNFIVSKIGNTYSAASMMVLTHILDKAKEDEKILLASFGSGAGSDAFLFKVTGNIKNLKKAKTTQEYIDDKEYISYGEYCKLTYL
ncbi:MAG: hydroxymethylglutaryl-CoA synthase [Nanoarchaeota archaeon]